MPQQDGTGPVWGGGSGAGFGNGTCEYARMPGRFGRPGYGFGMGRRGYCYYDPQEMPETDQKELIDRQVTSLQNQIERLTSIKKNLDKGKK